jgi:hypothetical protein
MDRKDISEPGFYWATLKHSVLPFAARTIVHIMENHKAFRNTPERFYLWNSQNMHSTEGFRSIRSIDDYENFNGPIKEKEE